MAEVGRRSSWRRRCRPPARSPARRRPRRCRPTGRPRRRSWSRCCTPAERGARAERRKLEPAARELLGERAEVPLQRQPGARRPGRASAWRSRAIRVSGEWAISRSRVRRRSSSAASSACSMVIRPRSSRSARSRRSAARSGETSSAAADGVGRAVVRDEIADREVGLVADRRDDRPGRGEDRAGDALVVEAGQLLRRAAAAPDDHDVDGAAVGVAPGGEPLERRDQLDGGAVALDGAVAEHDLADREAARQDGDDVVVDGAGLRGHQPDPLREVRQRALPLLGEQALLLQLEAQRLEPKLRLADAGRVEQVDDDLGGALGRVEVEACRARRRRRRPAAWRRSGWRSCATSPSEAGRRRPSARSRSGRSWPG